MSSFDLHGHVALVTGASRGIGRAVALSLAQAGADLVLVGRDEATLGAVAEEVGAFGGVSMAVVADIGSEQEVDALAQQALGRFPQLHVLVNNAAISPSARPAQAVTMADWDHVMDVNLRGTFCLTQRVGRHMIEHGYGRVINITSVLAEQGVSCGVPYAPAKAALRSLTQCLAADWAQYGINVNALAPGFTETDMNTRGRQNTTFYETVVDRVAQRRWGRPEDLGGAAVFLSSPAAEYVTGSTLVVDGGYSNTWSFQN